jgi:Rieske Fe-S protein
MNPPPSSPDITRRSWTKQFILGSAAAMSGPHWSAAVLADVASTGPGPGIIRIKPSAFPALANPGGSIQLQFSQLYAPLTLNRVSTDRFVTLDSVCSHAGCTVGRYIVTSGQSSMTCGCHGSRYDIEGRVFRNAQGVSTEPAPDDLGRYGTAYDATSGIIAITLPGLRLHIDSITVHQKDQNGKIRLKLVFPVAFGALYEIRYQPDLSSPSTPIPHSTTPSGTADKTTIGPGASGNFTAYIDATGSMGYFTVGVKLTPVL